MSKTKNDEKLQDSDHIHFRRCHLCGVLNEKSDQLVDRCSSCRKAFAPFVFFDEKKALGISDDSLDSPAKKASSYKITRLATESNYPPIWGLTVYW